MNEKRLFLLDAYALIFRAYYALIRMPRVTSQGLNTSAIFGFVNSLEELLRKEKPSHIAVCFDPSGPTFRHEVYPAYKGEREATPEDIKLSIPYIKRIIEAYRIPIIEVPGFEADDVIGTMAKRAEEGGFTTYMMTPDKDFGQLVTDNILQYKPAHKGQEIEVRGVREVCERYGVEHTEQVIDLLALMGDKVDNIPGCPGVGEKTAVKLIAEYGSVERLIENASQLKGALRKKVEENIEQIKFSKFLATIRTDVPVDINLDDLKLHDANADAISEIFDELEFKQLKDRVLKHISINNAKKASATNNRPAIVQGSLFGDEEPEIASISATESEPKPIEAFNALPHEYISVEDDALWVEMEAACDAAKAIGIAVHTIGTGDMAAQLKHAALAVDEGKVYFIDNITNRQSKQLLKLLTTTEACVVCHDIKRAYVALFNASGCRNIYDPGEPVNFFDVSLAHYLLQPELRHDLPLMASSYLRYEMLNEKSSIKDTLCEKADITLRLRAPLTDDLLKVDMITLFTEIEQPLAFVLARMEIVGVCVNVDALNDAARELNEQIATLEAEIWELAGEEFNISSPARVGDILFDKLQLDVKAKKLKSGRYSTSEEVLEKLVNNNPIVGKILRHRRLKKLVSTYLTALPAVINPHTGRIHTTYNQAVTVTGRISSSDPNLQNIPVRQEEGRGIRKAFTASPGHIFLSADYSQIELRLVADFANDEVMLQAFSDGTDIHAVTASKIYHKDIEGVTADERRKAKTANFGIIYGISAFGLANRLNIPRSEAKELIDNYFSRFPAIQRYMTESIEKAQNTGYVTTIHNRRRSLPDILSRNAVVRGYAERNAINAPIQGSAADIIKIAMVAIDRKMRTEGLRSRMIMQVHDELNFDVLPEELPIMQEIVKREMHNAYCGRVAMVAEVGTGPDWLTAH